MPHKDPEVRKAYLRERHKRRKAALPDSQCTNGGCTQSRYRGKYCYRCWVGAKWFSLTARLRNLNGNCASYVGVPLGMTREEFIEWALNNPPPEDMDWPSLDRIVSERGYRLDNIQWLDLRENGRKGAMEARKKWT